MTATTDDPRVLRLLDVDVELAAELAESELPIARQRLLAPVLELTPGRWTPPAGEGVPVGVLVLEGMLAHNIRLAGFPCTELLGGGDFLRPWDQASTIPATVNWVALTAGRVALLDDGFLTAMGQWPALAVALLRRSVRRSESLATHFAITCLVGLDVRIHTLFWHLADRWGRVTPEGVVLELPLTHESIARLVRSRRPSVSTALKRLAEADMVIRRDDDRWLLRGQPPRNLEEVAAEQMQRMAELAE